MFQYMDRIFSILFWNNNKLSAVQQTYRHNVLWLSILPCDCDGALGVVFVPNIWSMLYTALGLVVSSLDTIRTLWSITVHCWTDPCARIRARVIRPPHPCSRSANESHGPPVSRSPPHVVPRQSLVASSCLRT